MPVLGVPSATPLLMKVRPVGLPVVPVAAEVVAMGGTAPAGGTRIGFISVRKMVELVTMYRSSLGVNAMSPPPLSGTPCTVATMVGLPVLRSMT